MSDPLITAIAEDLQGTCKNLDEVCEQHGTSFDSLTIDQLRELDDITMCCEQCGWWCEACEFDNPDNQLCAECQPDDDD
jgi:hypothetical protein